MQRLRRGGRRERARRAGRPGARGLRGGARRSEAPASAPPRPDAAGDRAGLRQPPPSPPPPPPGERSKSLDLGKDAAPSGISTGAARRPPKPSQVMRTPLPSPSVRVRGAPAPSPSAFSDARRIWRQVGSRRSSRSPGVGTQRGEVSWNMGEISGASSRRVGSCAGRPASPEDGWEPSAPAGASFWSPEDS
ncbi:unnamed protein product [Rangifer tarandus platyrhynchus]|uniref:Uncharacterized protein n=2 Tax=Rangifer tarandus platyrhynchus TaxID=3082113 RepID=A0ABN8ZUC0_RANTA|nr:unnamed protein product [Rangifer tarandus platyrhynchus]CAI9710153.1 unnamed protein product [Rangifer tarandus platyrhynchus]